MTPQTLRERVRQLFDVLRPNALDVLGTFVELYADEVRFQDPLQVTDGRDAFVATTRRLIERARELAFTVHDVVGTDDEFFVTWTMVFAMKVGPRSRVDGVSHFRARDGRVVLHRDYWDIANLAASMVPGGERVLRTLLRPLT